MAQTMEVEELLDHLEQMDRMLLVELAEQGRGLDLPPTFRGRCLEPAYLEAVACGAWSLDDQALLTRYENRLEAAALSRVRRLDRRALRAVLRGAVLALMTSDLPVAGWEQRCRAFSRTWESVVGPLVQEHAVAE